MCVLGGEESVAGDGGGGEETDRVDTELVEMM